MNSLIQIVTSPITNVVLTLLILFQWFWQRAKEQSIRNQLFALRRILSRSLESENNVYALKANDLIDIIDAVLTTLDARPPFTDRLKEVLNSIRDRVRLASKMKLEKLPNEGEAEI